MFENENEQHIQRDIYSTKQFHAATNSAMRYATEWIRERNLTRTRAADTADLSRGNRHERPMLIEHKLRFESQMTETLCKKKM